MVKRRKPLDPITQSKQFFWPENGWKRNFLYYWKRLARIPDTPHSIALGFSIGVFIAFSPFLGIHTILCIFFSWVVGANIPSSIIGTFVGNPITYPVIWTTSIGIGNFLLNRQSLDYDKSNSLIFFKTDFLMTLKPVFIPLFFGGLILGFLFALVSYFLIKYLILIFRNNRSRRGE